MPNIFVSLWEDVEVNAVKLMLERKYLEAFRLFYVLDTALSYLYLSIIAELGLGLPKFYPLDAQNFYQHAILKYLANHPSKKEEIVLMVGLAKEAVKELFIEREALYYIKKQEYDKASLLLENSTAPLSYIYMSVLSELAVRTSKTKEDLTLLAIDYYIKRGLKPEEAGYLIATIRHQIIRAFVRKEKGVFPTSEDITAAQVLNGLKADTSIVEAILTPESVAMGVTSDDVAAAQILLELGKPLSWGEKCRQEAKTSASITR